MQTKQEILTGILQKTPKAVSTVLESVKTDYEKLEIVTKTLELYKYDFQTGNQARKELLQTLADYSADLLGSVLAESPSLIIYLEDKQTLLLTQLAYDSEDFIDSNFVHIFPKLNYQTKEMAHAAVTADVRCYKYVKPENKSYELALMVADSGELKPVEIDREYLTEELLTRVIKARAKSVCHLTEEHASPELLEKLQLMAIEETLHAMPTIERVKSQKVIDRFKELSIQKRFFDGEWTPTLNHTQQELYSMLEKNPKWLGVMQILQLLDNDHLKKAHQSNLVHYNIDWGTDYLMSITDIETLGCLLEHTKKSSAEKFFKALMSDPHLHGDVVIEKLVETNGMVLRSLPKEYHNAKICLKAVKQNTDALKHVYLDEWTPELLECIPS